MRKYDELMLKKFGERYCKYKEIYSSSFNLKLDFPLHVDIDLRDACNLNYPACHNINRKRSKNIIDKDMLYLIVDECKKK